MISVCIATYNGEKYIREQIESILPQLSLEDEIIISDDNSSDNTLAIIKSIADPHIKILKHKKSPAKFTIDYATHNFENALLQAKGEYIFLSDQDDVWMPNKVAEIMSNLRTCDIVLSDCSTTDTDLNVINHSYYKSERIFHPSLVWNFFKPSFLGSCMAFNRKVLEKSLPFPKYGVGHDLWIGLIGLKHFKFKFVDSPLIYYRRHSETVTDGGKQNKTSLLFKIKYRLYVLKTLLFKL